uniref:Uncharacterized protein n=1 Tax=Cacopsylla melanoneura TaxID=428564 RepID=A0A8D9BUE9_9HEMI
MANRDTTVTLCCRWYTQKLRFHIDNGIGPQKRPYFEKKHPVEYRYNYTCKMNIILRSIQCLTLSSCEILIQRKYSINCLWYLLTTPVGLLLTDIYFRDSLQI